MSHHPTGIQVDLVGIEEGGRGRSCEEHQVCGKVLTIDAVVRLRCIQIKNGTLSPFIERRIKCHYMLLNAMFFFSLFLKKMMDRKKPRSVHSG